MNELKIGDSVWHPCNSDVVEYKIINIQEYVATQLCDNITRYIVKAVHNVGGFGTIEIILDETNDKLRFVGVFGGDYADGLKDYLEGVYYVNKKEAKLKFYEIQRTLVLPNVYEETKKSFGDIDFLIKTLKEEINSDYLEKK